MRSIEDLMSFSSDAELMRSSAFQAKDDDAMEITNDE
jgi:hypothetical protein